jgi:plasmid rolling circle replication initiator protein Rep
MQARKELEFTDFDPNDESERLYSQQESMWYNEFSVRSEVEEWVQKLIAVMERGERLKVTLEVVEDE